MNRKTPPTKKTTSEPFSFAFPGKILKLFFLGDDKIFNIGFKRQFLESDLESPSSAPLTQSLDEFEAVYKKLQSNPDPSCNIQLSDIFKELFQKQLIHAALILSVSLFCWPVISILGSTVNKYLLNHYEEWTYPIFLIFLFALVVSLQYIFLNAANSRISACTTKATYILKGLLFKKVQTGSYIFVNHIDNALMTRLVEKDIVAITNWMALIPKILATPVVIIIAYWYVVSKAKLGIMSIYG